MQLLPKTQMSAQMSERSQLQVVENADVVECAKSDRVVIFIDGSAYTP